MITEKDEFMRKIFPVFILLLIASLTGPSISTSLALDKDGCLTCHQYPGLVQQDKTTGFNVLHIDETAYMQSVHGKISCRKCHTTIDKVPHTSETEINCNTSCHLKPEDQKKIKTFPLKGYHRKEQSYITRLDDDTSCRVCHPLYPHSKNNLVRGLVNMHTGFMLCEVCHIKRTKLEHITYDWIDSEDVEFSGKPFGSYFNPHTGTAHKTENYVSRIGLFIDTDGRKQLVTESADTGKARNYLKIEKGMAAAEKEKQLDFFHRHIEKKEISVACNECHAVNGMLDFRKLGFDEIKTDHLIKLNVKGLVTKYKTFYFPHLFDK